MEKTDKKKIVVGDSKNKDDKSFSDYFSDEEVAKAMFKTVELINEAICHNLRPKKKINYKELTGVRSKCRVRRKVRAMVKTSCYTVPYDSPDWEWRKEISEDDESDEECTRKPEMKV